MKQHAKNTFICPGSHHLPDVLPNVAPELMPEILRIQSLERILTPAAEEICNFPFLLGKIIGAHPFLDQCVAKREDPQRLTIRVHNREMAKAEFPH